MKLYLYRHTTSSEGTFGFLLNENRDVLFYTVECPWLDNVPFKSCIPPGWYKTEWIESPSHGYVLEFKNVVDRKFCQFHIANFAHELEGCVGLGTYKGEIYSKKLKREIMAVAHSRIAINNFNKRYGNKDIIIVIENNF